LKPPDPRKAFFVFISGKKGEGKSHYSRAWFDDYPFDRLVIDPTGDIADDLTREGVPYKRLDPHMLPTSFPRSDDDRDKRATAVLVPDMGAPTVVDDMDRAVGLALRGRDQHCLLWIDEFGAVTRGNKTPPNTRRLLHQGRHHNITALLPCPRPMDVDPLGIAQADLVVTFRTPQVYDRQRIADTIGYDRGEFDRENQALGHNCYTAYDAVDDQLYIMPPLPPRRAGRNGYAPVPE
jgi:hypothetical protein